MLYNADSTPGIAVHRHVWSGVLPTESLYTAQVTTRMCVNDDANLIESSSSSQTVGDPGEFQYIIKALQDTYTPIDDVSGHALVVSVIDRTHK